MGGLAVGRGRRLDVDTARQHKREQCPGNPHSAFSPADLMILV
jgi:hypothetical protein